MNQKIALLLFLLFFQQNSFSQPETVTDIDGNSYKTILIGNQLWMAENLRTTKLNDGTKISYLADKFTWSNSTSPLYCWDNNNENDKNKIYGALYNWYTVETGKICPIGWHVPSKSIGTNKPYITVGYRDENGSFWLVKNRCSIWTSTEYSIYQAYHTVLFFDNSQSQIEIADKKYGISIRCVKEYR